MTIQYRDHASPFGPLRLVAEGGCFTGLQLPYRRRQGSLLPQGPAEPGWLLKPDLLPTVVAQLDAYFAGDLRDFRPEDFDLPLRLHGTAFQQEVWQALLRIPAGRTCSYGELARSIGKPAAVRAVGAANGANPVAIIVPCHRVIGADGSLHGYGGGLELKQQLLALEQGQFQGVMLT